MKGLRLTLRGELTIYATAFLTGFLSIPMGWYWT